PLPRARAGAPARGRRRAARLPASRSTRRRARPARRRSPRPRARAGSPPRRARRLPRPARRARATGRWRAPRPAASPAARRRPRQLPSPGRAAAPPVARERGPPGATQATASVVVPPSVRALGWSDKRSRERMFYTNTCSPVKFRIDPVDRVRVDKWLWAARFAKTRSAATDLVLAGHVKVGGERVKPAREVTPGDTIEIRLGMVRRVVVVTGLADRRGPAKVAATLYEEKPESREERGRLALERGIARPLGGYRGARTR